MTWMLPYWWTPALPRHHQATHHQWLRRALDVATVHDAVGEAVERLASPQRGSDWTEQLSDAAQLQHVLVHGDIHEHQMLAKAGQLTGIIDWETARIDHPYWDFDLGEWGIDLWRQHRHRFSILWAQAWKAYARERNLNPDPRPLETAFRVRHALRLLDDAGDPGIVGTIDEHLAHV